MCAVIAQGSKGRNAGIARTRWSRGCAWSGFGRLAVALQGAGRTTADKGSQADENRGQAARANRPSVSRADGPPEAFWGQFGSQYSVLSPRGSKTWRWNVCRPDSTGWRSAPGLPPSLRPGGHRHARGTGCLVRRPGAHAVEGAGRSLRAPGADRGARDRGHRGSGCGRSRRRPVGAVAPKRAVEGAGRSRCRSGGGALPGGKATEHLFIGANGETRRSERRRQLRRQRGGSRPAKGAVRPGDGSGEREEVNPARPTHVSLWFQRWPGSGTTGERGGRRFCGQARQPSRPRRGRRQSGIEAPTRRGLRADPDAGPPRPRMRSRLPVGVARGPQHADVAAHACGQQRVDAGAPRDHVELGADQDAEAPLEDADVARLGRQLVDDLEALRAFDAGRCQRLSVRGSGMLAGAPAVAPIPEETARRRPRRPATPPARTTPALVRTGPRPPPGRPA